MTTSTPSTRLRRVRWLGATVAGVLVAAGLMSSTAQAATTTSSVIATADTTVNSSTPTKPTASSNSMGVYGSPQIIGLVRFVIPTAPAGKTLTGATLRLRTTTIASAGSASAVTVRSAGDTWSESTATWNNRPALGSTVLGTLPAGSQPNTAYAVALNMAAWGKPTGSGEPGVADHRHRQLLAVDPRAVQQQLPSDPPADLVRHCTLATPPRRRRPAGLTATPSGSTVNLSWTASTDATGVTGYTVHRSATAGFTPTAATAIGTPTTTTFSDPSRPNGTWYYRVVARDAATNTSDPSNQATAVVNVPPSDTTAPTAPTGLTATPSGSTVNLSWTASTDATGVTGYTVHRSATAGFTPTAATAVGTPTTTTFSDPSRPNGTWYYRVVARDAATNTSDPSDEANAVVDVPDGHDGAVRAHRPHGDRVRLDREPRLDRLHRRHRSHRLHRAPLRHCGLHPRPHDGSGNAHWHLVRRSRASFRDLVLPRRREGRRRPTPATPPTRPRRSLTCSRRP